MLEGTSSIAKKAAFVGLDEQRRGAMKRSARRRKKKQASVLEVGAGGDLKWTFPANPLGQDSGFHDAGVETFKGDFYRYLAREAIQNSLDAKARGARQPVQVKFQIVELSLDDLPDFLSDASRTDLMSLPTSG